MEIPANISSSSSEDENNLEGKDGAKQAVVLEPGQRPLKQYTSPREKVRLALYYHALRESPYADSQLYKTLTSKAEQLCALVTQQPGPGGHQDIEYQFNRLAVAFIRHMQPLLWIHKSCSKFLPMDNFTRFPTLEALMTTAIQPLHDRRIEQIRDALADKKIFLSISHEDFRLYYDPLTNGPIDSSEKFTPALFIIVGPSNDLQQEEPERRYLLKAVKLLSTEDDNLTDDWFVKLVLDSLKLLWPVATFENATKYLTHLITEADFELDTMLPLLQTSTPGAFDALIHIPNCTGLLYRLEKNFRSRHPTVTEVIDTLRVQWLKCATFREKMSLFSDFTPPTSFYTSPVFYQANFATVQKVVLNWRGRRFRESIIREAFTDVEFKQSVIDLAAKSELLSALERATYVESHQLSIQVGNCIAQLVKMHDEAKEENGGPGLGIYAGAYRRKITSELGGVESVKQRVIGGDYQLFQFLLADILHTTRRLEYLLQSGTLLKYSILGCLKEGLFKIPEKTPKLAGTEAWTEPLYGSQLRRSFPQFWYLFAKFQRPFPMTFLDRCAVVYAYAEVVFYEKDKEEEEEQQALMAKGASSRGQPTSLEYPLLPSYSNNPYYESSPRETFNRKSSRICADIFSLPASKEHRIGRLVKEYFRQILPLTRLRFAVNAYDRTFTSGYFPKPPQLAQSHAAPIYAIIQEQIRKEIAGKKLFLSWTVASFQNADTLYGRPLEGRNAYLFVFLGIYSPDFSKAEAEQKDDDLVKVKYCLRVHEMYENEPFSANLFKLTFLDSLRILWPFVDSDIGRFEKAGENILYLFTEPDCTLDEVIAGLLSHPSMASIRHYTYTHTLLGAIEINYTQEKPEKVGRELIGALARAAGLDPYLLSRSLNRCLEEVLALNRQYLKDFVLERWNGKVERLRAEIGGSTFEECMSFTGDFQLLEDLVGRLLHRLPAEWNDDVVVIASSQLTRLHLMRFIMKQKFLPGLRKTSQANSNVARPSTWIPPLRACQLERAFPAFWSMFLKHPGPVPWGWLPYCAVAYCYAEENAGEPELF